MDLIYSGKLGAALGILLVLVFVLHADLFDQGQFYAAGVVLMSVVTSSKGRKNHANRAWLSRSGPRITQHVIDR